MIDVLFFLIFAWILSFIHLDDMVLELLKSGFDRDFSIIAYYVLFAIFGVFSRLLFALQGIRLRD